MRCQICQAEFTPNKYHPQQKVCSQPSCQRARQLQNEREWRAKNPDYFKCLGQTEQWQQVRHSYSKLWRANHKDYLKTYEQNHKEQRKEYMRNYMRRYRESLNVNKDKI